MNKPKIITKTVSIVDNVATGAAARAFRESIGIPFVEFAKHMGISTSMLSYMETGVRGEWTDDFMNRYIAAVKVAATAKITALSKA